MDWDSLFRIVQAWGPSAISSVLIVVVLSFIKKVDKIEDSNAANLKEIRTQIEEKITGVKEQFSTRFKEHKTDMERLYTENSERLFYIQQEYTRNDAFYRDVSGWKGDINRLSDRVDDKFESVNKTLMQIYARGGGGNEG